jgi:hypothetical protein
MAGSDLTERGGILPSAPEVPGRYAQNATADWAARQTIRFPTPSRTGRQHAPVETHARFRMDVTAPIRHVL